MVEQILYDRWEVSVPIEQLSIRSLVYRPIAISSNAAHPNRAGCVLSISLWYCMQYWRECTLESREEEEIVNAYWLTVDICDRLVGRGPL